jgi:hypothetical protein
MHALTSEPGRAREPRVDPDLLLLMDPNSPPPSQDEAEPLDGENDKHDDRGFPSPDPQAESHPELRANVRFTRLSDPPARRRFSLSHLRDRKR